MRITRLALRQFRNHSDTVLELDGRHVCLFGPNGAGKTNLLEAVSLLGPGKGLRSAPLPSLTRSAQDEKSLSGWDVAARLDDNGLERKLGIGLEQSQDGRAKRYIKLDDVSVAQSEMAELLRVVWITPAMDRVFSGAAGDRRKFYDRQVLAHAPMHGKYSSAYEKAMRERNALLESGRSDPAWLDGLEARMAETGASIAINRSNVLTRLQNAIDRRPEGYFPKADLKLDGAFEEMALNGLTPDEIGAELAQALHEGRRRDMAAGRTLSGPHRTDLLVYHRPKSLAAAQCSTGEQKALLIGLILANAKALLEGDFAPNPLLLLDEAAAHLDSDRRAALFDELAALGGQAWLTGTDASLFDAFSDRAQRFEIRDGSAMCVDPEAK